MCGFLQTTAVPVLFLPAHAVAFQGVAFSLGHGRYLEDLLRLKARARDEGAEFVTWNDIQSCVDSVNTAVHEEHESEWLWEPPGVALGWAELLLGSGSLQSGWWAEAPSPSPGSASAFVVGPWGRGTPLGGERGEERKAVVPCPPGGWDLFVPLGIGARAWLKQSPRRLLLTRPSGPLAVGGASQGLAA